MRARHLPLETAHAIFDDILKNPKRMHSVGHALQRDISWDTNFQLGLRILRSAYPCYHNPGTVLEYARAVLEDLKIEVTMRSAINQYYNPNSGIEWTVSYLGQRVRDCLDGKYGQER